MKRILMTVALGVAMISSLSAQTKVDDKTTIYDIENGKLHVYQSGDAMGNVSFIVEGQDKLVILEQPMFWDNISEFNNYVDALDKPIAKVVANFHFLGLADYKSSLVAMPKAMVEFENSAAAQAMVTKFDEGFGEIADFRAHKKVKGFDVPSTQNWADVELVFTPAPQGGFPAANILIGKKAYYAHFAPAISHASPMRVKSRASLDSMLEELQAIKDSGADYVFGSHGAAATQKEVAFQAEYLQTIQSLLAECSSSDIFGQRLIVAYPTLAGSENVRAIAKALYPDEQISEQKQQVLSRVQDYFDMVSNLDMDIAKELWAEDLDISIITPKTQFFGFDSIMNDFLIKAFSSMQSRKLSSLSEVANVYDNSANVQLYWVFDTVDAQGEKHRTRGRESLIFEKIDGQWKLVHVHYSRMPE